MCKLPARLVQDHVRIAPLESTDSGRPVPRVPSSLQLDVVPPVNNQHVSALRTNTADDLHEAWSKCVVLSGVDRNVLPERMGWFE